MSQYRKNALRKRNLSMIQKVSSVMVEGGLKVSVETVFSDETLESITFPPLECFVPNDSPNLIQALGKAITYLRRYSLLAACGVVGEEDDDGNAVGKATASSPARPVRQFEAKSAPPKPPEHQPAIEPAFLQLGLVPEEISALQKGMSLPELRQFYNYLKQAGKEMEGQGGVDAVIAVLREEGGGAVTPQVAKGRIRG